MACSTTDLRDSVIAGPRGTVLAALVGSNQVDTITRTCNRTRAFHRPVEERSAGRGRRFQPAVGSSSLATDSIQSTASSESWGPSADSPAHHSESVVPPVTAMMSPSTFGGSGSPLCSMSQSRVSASTRGHHSRMFINAVLQRRSRAYRFPPWDELRRRHRLTRALPPLATPRGVPLGILQRAYASAQDTRMICDSDGSSTPIGASNAMGIPRARDH